ncbi:hypothetical protein ACFL43_00710 [Thermodesulfobacteriota bacterium]
MKRIGGGAAILILLFIVSITPCSYAQQIFPTGSAPAGYRYTENNAPGDTDYSCFDPQFCVCWHLMDVNFTNSGPAAYDVRAYMTCRPCSMDDTWPGRIYDVEMGDIPSGGNSWSQSNFAFKADACTGVCPIFSNNPCWNIEYRDTPGGAVKTIVNVPWDPVWGCECGETYTIISLAALDADPGNKSITITWETESEIDNAGFNIYRAEAANGEYTLLNTSLIAAEGNPAHGASYEFVDQGLQNRKTYYYKLEDIDQDGTATMHGPVDAMPRLIHSIKK